MIITHVVTSNCLLWVEVNSHFVEADVRCTGISADGQQNLHRAEKKTLKIINSSFLIQLVQITEQRMVSATTLLTKWYIMVPAMSGPSYERTPLMQGHLLLFLYLLSWSKHTYHKRPPATKGHFGLVPRVPFLTGTTVQLIQDDSNRCLNSFIHHVDLEKQTNKWATQMLFKSTIMQ